MKTLFENEDLLAVEKPVGIATIRERNQESDCLIDQARQQSGLPLMVVHRLDKDVSGVVVFAKNPDSHRTLNILFDQRAVKKSYLAVAHGEISPERGTIHKPIRQFGSGRMGVDEAKGKESITEYVLEEAKNGFSRVRLFPKTGRRHQLRVHLYSIGHPIVGDPLYGDKEIQKNFPRLMLHAHTIEFDWKNQGILRIESPVPPEFFGLCS